MINELYLNLDTLEFTQKFSIGKNEILIYDFLYFIKNCNCNRLYINDNQSEFLKNIKK